MYGSGFDILRDTIMCKNTHIEVFLYVSSAEPHVGVKHTPPPSPLRVYIATLN